MKPRILILVALLALGVGSSARAESNLKNELAIVAQDIARFLKGRGEDSIAIGQFAAPPQLAASAGPGIAHILSEELGKAGIEVKLRAPLGIKGEYRDVKDTVSGKLAAEIKGEVVDRSGEVLLNFSRGVFGDATLAFLFGTTVKLTPDADHKQRDKELEQSLDNPQCHFRGNAVLTAAGSPYGIEILIKQGNGYRPLVPKIEDGLAFVHIERDQIYAVNLVNDSAHDAAVTLTIDGINMFAFSENKNYYQMIVPPKSKGLIRGWHRNNQLSDSFLVTEYSKSAAAELNLTGGPLGTITASFAAAWTAGTSPPPDEPADPNKFSRSANATGRGPQVKENYSEVQRNFGVTRGSVSVRYTK